MRAHKANFPAYGGPHDCVLNAYKFDFSKRGEFNAASLTRDVPVELVGQAERLINPRIRDCRGGHPEQITVLGMHKTHFQSRHYGDGIFKLIELINDRSIQCYGNE